MAKCVFGLNGIAAGKSLASAACRCSGSGFGWWLEDARGHHTGAHLPGRAWCHHPNRNGKPLLHEGMA